MARIVFFCIPAHGHTNPTLGVVRELAERGHEVLYYSYQPFREKIEAAGATFFACDDFDAEFRLTKEESARLGSDLALSTRVLVDTTLALVSEFCVAARDLLWLCDLISMRSEFTNLPMRTTFRIRRALHLLTVKRCTPAVMTATRHQDSVLRQFL